MNKIIPTALMIAASLFAKNTHAQTAVPFAVTAKDTTHINTIFRGQSGGIAFAADNGDTLTMWRPTNPRDTAPMQPTVRFGLKNPGFYENGSMIVETVDRVYKADKLSNAQLLLLEHGLNGPNILMRTAGKADLGTRLTF